MVPPRALDTSTLFGEINERSDFGVKESPRGVLPPKQYHGRGARDTPSGKRRETGRAFERVSQEAIKLSEECGRLSTLLEGKTREAVDAFTELTSERQKTQALVEITQKFKDQLGVIQAHHKAEIAALQLDHRNIVKNLEGSQMIQQEMVNDLTTENMTLQDRANQN